MEEEADHEDPDGKQDLNENQVEHDPQRVLPLVVLHPDVGVDSNKYNERGHAASEVSIVVLAKLKHVHKLRVATHHALRRLQ